MCVNCYNTPIYDTQQIFTFCWLIYLHVKKKKLIS